MKTRSSKRSLRSLLKSRRLVNSLNAKAFPLIVIWQPMTSNGRPFRVIWFAPKKRKKKHFFIRTTSSPKPSKKPRRKKAKRFRFKPKPQAKQREKKKNRKRSR